MKIKLYSNGQIINPPLRVAQRYIRLGKASIYEEPIKEIKPSIIEIDQEFEDLPEVTEENKNEIKISKSKKIKKAKEEPKEEIIESTIAEG